jgi:hypothetical protein
MCSDKMERATAGIRAPAAALDIHLIGAGEMPTSDHTTSVEYKPIPGYAGYRIGTDGSIWSCRVAGRTRLRFGELWKPIATYVGKDGRVRVSLPLDTEDRRAGGRLKDRKLNVHALVLTAFVGPKPDGMECRHLNGNLLDNRLENLRWGTHSDNERDKRIHRAPKSNQTYLCHRCKVRACAKPGTKLVCGLCGAEMV